jgi:hypothetical protein
MEWTEEWINSIGMEYGILLLFVTIKELHICVRMGKGIFSKVVLDIW